MLPRFIAGGATETPADRFPVETFVVPTLEALLDLGVNGVSFEELWLDPKTFESVLETELALLAAGGVGAPALTALLDDCDELPAITSRD